MFKPWKIESLLQMLLGLFGGMFLFGVLTMSLGYTPAPDRVNHVMLLVSAISFPGVGILWLHWFIRDHDLTWPQALGFKSPRWLSAISLGVLTGTIGFLVCNQLGGLMEFLLRKSEIATDAQTTIQALQTTVSPVWVIAFAVITIVVAPVVEEFVFRGLFFPVIKQSGYPIAAWLVSSVVFSAIHANLLAFVPLMVLALALTWIYERTDNLLAPIFTHATFNAINFGLTLKMGALSSAGATQ